ncbi:transmembrane protein 115 [Patella vulgata]|uniref:transmembrane protein 115 n=1 Tax=Patella vulgata TaxID=6465 RepID=UPI00217F75CC|nr:transmembrane protein 115 [Patella vulgata]
MATSMAHSKVTFCKEQLSAAFGKSSVVVKFVAVTVTVGYLLTFISSAIPYITITPGYVIPPNGRFYSLFTYAFVELHFWDVLVDIAVVILCGKLLEPLWGALDMLLFFTVVNICVGLLTSFCYLFQYLLTKNDEYLFETHIYGLAGFIAAFSVAVKQVMPDHILFTSPFGKLRNTHIPLLLLLTAITLRLVGLLDGPYPYLFGWGIMVSWIYLRFYQKHSNGNRGDMADNFSFASFFPSQLQPFIAVLSNTVFMAFVKIKICKKPQRRYDVSSPTTITISLPGTDPQDAERRRQVALKALNERLCKSETPAKWPSLVDESGNKSPGSSPERELSDPPPAVHKKKIPVPEFKEMKSSVEDV